MNSNPKQTPLQFFSQFSSSFRDIENLIMECCVGLKIGEVCHKNTYGAVKKNLISLNDLNQDDQKLLKLRVDSNISRICEYHKIVYLQRYNHLFGASCCDPLNSHAQRKKKGSKGCSEIKLAHLDRHKNHDVNLIPGKSLCPTCYNKIFRTLPTNDEDCVTNFSPSSLFKKPLTPQRFRKAAEVQPTTSAESDDNLVRSESSFIASDGKYEEIDKMCAMVKVSPISKVKRLHSKKRLTAIRRKSIQLSVKIDEKLNKTLNPSQKQSTQQSSSSVPFCDQYLELIEALKTKCVVANQEDKVRIISLMPSSWSRSKIAQELQVSERLVRSTKDLVKEQGILPRQNLRQGRPALSEQTILTIEEFYQKDEYTRVMPGKKDFVSVRTEKGKKGEQKRLILCNLKELYTAFKDENPQLKVGFSKFCSFRPKWCVLAGASGTHSVCVCVYHQNVKLMLEGTKMNASYSDFLELLSCDTSNYKCMMGECSDCPSVDMVRDFLRDEMEDMEEEISYKQWVGTDRSTLITIVQTVEEFIENLLEKLIALKKHHYISKVQSNFLKEKKANLLADECIVLGDFSENYSCVIQDASQAVHWSKTQVTLHPFVVYYKDGKDLKFKNFCMISDFLEHNTVAVHTFQKHLVSEIKNILPHVRKIFYFSDGASSQYKNRKNFGNLCRHKDDFGLNAEWNFFASCHGKSPCDGIGGTSKRLAAKASLQRPYSDQILTPFQFFEFCSHNIPGIKYIFVQKEEVKETEIKLQERFQICNRVPSTRQQHRLIPISSNSLRCYKTSTAIDYEEVMVFTRQLKFHASDFKKSDCIVCLHDGLWYPAEVQEINLEDEKISVVFFKPPGPRTSFHKSKHQCWIPVSKVLRGLSPLELTRQTSRNSYQIPEKLCDLISTLFNEYSNCK